MDCHQVQNLLSEYLDGELPAGQARLLEAHTSSCPDCAPALADLRAVVSELHRLPALSAPQDLSSSVMSRIRSGGEEAVPPRRKITPVGASLLAAAACLLVVFTGFLLTERGTQPSPQIASSLYDEQAPLSRASEAERAQPERKMARSYAAPEESVTLAAKIAPVQPAPAATKPAALFTAQGKRVPAFKAKESTKSAAGRGTLEQRQVIGKKMRQADAAARKAPAPSTPRRMSEAEGEVRQESQRDVGTGQEAELEEAADKADTLAKKQHLAHRTITVVTNDLNKAAADIGKRIRIIRRASQRRRIEPVSGPITAVMTQPEYLALLTDLEKAGYSFERQALGRRRARAVPAVEPTQQVTEALGPAEALRVTIRFRRTAEAPAGAKEAQEKQAPVE